MSKPVLGTVGDRLRAVREALRLSQHEIVSLLNETAEALYGDEAPLFNQGRVSKLEVGAQRASLEDIAIYDAIDPKQRGKLWLGWNEPPATTAARPRRHGPSVIQEPPEDIFDQPIPRKKPGRRPA